MTTGGLDGLRGVLTGGSDGSQDWSRRATESGPARGVFSVGRRGLQLGSVAYEQIKEQLLEGRWAAGQRLSPETFRAQLGVSKQPVMDALRRLAVDGLVEIIPQVGCRVAAYSRQEVEDFFTLFGAFEGAIAGVAAARRTDADLALLRVRHAEIGALCSEHDAGARAHGYRALNRDFHGLIHRMARSHVVEEMSLRMWDLSDFLINTAGVPQPLAGALDTRHADHEAVYRALVAGDPAAARSAMERHILGTVDVIGAEFRGGLGSLIAGGIPAGAPSRSRSSPPT